MIFQIKSNMTWERKHKEMPISKRIQDLTIVFAEINTFNALFLIIEMLQLFDV